MNADIDNLSTTSAQLTQLTEAARRLYATIETSPDQSDTRLRKLAAQLHRLTDQIIDLELDELEAERARAEYLLWAQQAADPLDEACLRRLLVSLAGGKRR